MAMVHISGLYIDIPPEAIPAPPAPSASIVRALTCSRHGPRATGSLAFEPSEIKQSVAVESACRVRIQVTGVFGHSAVCALVYAGIARNGVMLENDATLASARVPGPLDLANFAIDIVDTIGAAGSYEYELYIRQSDQTAGAKGYIGQRAQNADPTVFTTISLTVLDP